MYLIVGLGNPGSQYVGTRHNVGFMLLDYLAQENNVSFTESKWKALMAKTVIWGESVILLKPETFMNASGTALAAAAKYYKILTDNIIVIHDDLDMPLGRIKMVSGGGDGGHKGIRSSITHLGTRDFPRVKIGIGRPSSMVPPENYVLGRFEPDEHELIKQRMAVVVEGIKVFMQQGISAAMNAVNQKE
jgi:PTH1 family peptidyl-tRNA hydrolase